MDSMLSKECKELIVLKDDLCTVYSKKSSILQKNYSYIYTHPTVKKGFFYLAWLVMKHFTINK